MSKLSKRLLSWLLLAAMLCTLLPTVAFAADTDSSDDDFYRIVHLDCGRKYFTKDWIIALLNEMKADGYNQLQLAFGNDGFRFLLDDMSVTVDEKTYSSDNVKTAIASGNEAYDSEKSYTTDTDALTQTEMNEIIAHANSLGIEIVPMLNTPGHMYALLSAMTTLKISTESVYYQGKSTSEYSLNLSNSTAVEFTKALLTKYVKYFSEKGCSFFHIGTDEFANDAYSSMGFTSIKQAGYDKYVEYVNDVAEIVTTAGMTPRVWNDGIYYGSYSATFNSGFQITYWTSGWSEYDVAKPTDLADKGYKMINTHGNYYYVVGKTIKQWTNGYSGASDWDNTAFMGGTISNPAGSMFCIWSDEPAAETETQVAKNVRLILRAMGLRMQEDTFDILDEGVVPGGFNENGTLNTSSTGGSTDNGNGGTDTDTTIQGNATLGENGSTTLSLSSGAMATWTSSNENVIQLTPADEVSSQSTEVKAAKVTATAVRAGKATITAKTETGSYETTITVTDGTTEGKPIEIEIAVGETYTLDFEDADYREIYTIEDKNVATAKAEYTEESGGLKEGNISLTSSFTRDKEYNQVVKCGEYYLKVNDKLEFEATGDINQATVFTIKINSKSNTNSTISCEVAGETYYLVYDNSSLKLSTEDKNVWYYNYDGSSNLEGLSIWVVLDQYFLTYSSGGWTFSSDPTSRTDTYPYSVTEGAAVPEKTTITVKGVYPGETTLMVDGTIYNITVKHKEVTVNLTYGELYEDYQTKNISGGAEVTPEGIVDVEIKNDTVTITAGNTDGTATVTVGDTIYYVMVTKEDLSKVGPVTVEYWITNVRAAKNENETKVTSLEVRAAEVYGADGKLISELVPATAVRAKETDYKLAFWQGRYLTDETQTEDDGVDRTQSGDSMVRIRYYNKTWSYQNADGEWKDIANAAQLVAYYLQVTDVTKEVTTEVVDWGIKKEKWSELENSFQNQYVLLDYTVKYTSGEENPNNFANENSLGFHCTTNDSMVFKTENGYYYRRIGATLAVNSSDYEVYLITATPTSNSPRDTLADNPENNISYTYDGTETVVWAETEADYENSDLGKYKSISGDFEYSVGGDPTVPGIEIYRQQGMKITYYVRAKETEDSLTVHYVDMSDGFDFYSYLITVAKDVKFNSDIDLCDEDEGVGNLKNGDVTNSLGVKQYVSSDLSTMPDISVKYRFVDYKVVRCELKPEGKELYIYYEFNNVVNFVADFGLPIKIEPTDLNAEFEDSTVNLDVKHDGSSSTTYGKLTHADGCIVYTPTTTISGVDTFVLYVMDKDEEELLTEDQRRKVTYFVNVYPANNVLYEETFVTDVTGWGSEGTALKSTQTTPDVTNDVYGNDAVYSENATFSNNTYLKASVTSDTSNRPQASFTFTGTGLELIGECGQNTGVLYVRVTNATDTGKSKVFLVDTYFSGSFVNSSNAKIDNIEMTYQIPVVQALNMPYSEHEVTVYGYYLKSCGALVNGTQATSGVATMSLSPSLTSSQSPDLDAILAEMGDEDAEVEYISMADLLGGSDNGVALYASQVYADSASTDSVDVYIDGFRVYDPMNGAGTAYAEKEQNYAFYSLYSQMSDWSAEQHEATGVVYVENVSSDGITFDNYKTNGPQNEIYLASGSAIAFKVPENVNVQVSAKVIAGSPKLNNDSTALTTQTALYYSVDQSQDGVVVICNNGEEKSILSLIDLKLTGVNGEEQSLQLSTSPITVDEVNAAIYSIQNPTTSTDPEEPEEPETPETPETPSEPTEPEQPDTPTEPTEPEQPETPSEPTEPTEPEQPETPSEPTEPTEPEQPETPSEPTEPTEPEQPETPSEPTEPEEPAEDPVENWRNPFKDVISGKFYFDAIRWFNAHGVLKGMTDTVFGLEESADRAMVITMLYRMEGEPEVTGESQFGDVRKGSYYEKAVIWAEQNYLVTGYSDGTFRPKQAITREEMIKMLYLYNEFKGLDPAGSANLNSYADNDQLHNYSKNAMRWAIDNGIVNGYHENGKSLLKPRDETRRSEMATLLYRVYQHIYGN